MPKEVLNLTEKRKNEILFCCSIIDFARESPNLIHWELIEFLLQ